MQDYGYVLVVIIGALAIISAVWRHRRANELLDGWARDNGLTVIAKQTRAFLRGPLSWTTSKGQTVFRVVVRDRDGGQRSGWVRCGGRRSGLRGDQVEARWDGE